MKNIPKTVKIVEVGPRDGLQNETHIVDSDRKIAFIDQLASTGLRHIEVTSFVRQDRIPQLVDAEEVFAGIQRIPGVHYSALVPNEYGLERALRFHPDSIAVFTAASETFCQRNIQCSIAESLDRFGVVIQRAKEMSLPVRAYISCVLGCPYEGSVRSDKVAGIARDLIALGVDEVSLGDTIGRGTPRDALEAVKQTTRHVPIEHVAVHFHNTYGQALANILACLQYGVSTIDASVAGLGGCPYAKGASGNVATEDVLYMLEGLGVETGVDLEKLISVGQAITETLGVLNMSNVGRATEKCE